MRKRRTVAVKKSTRSSNASINVYPNQISKIYNHNNDPLSYLAELEAMNREESEQRKVDSFWGQDKDCMDRQREVNAMMLHDEISELSRQWMRKKMNFQLWEEESRLKSSMEIQSKNHERNEERSKYMKLLENKDVTTPEIIQYNWKNSKTNFESLHSTPWSVNDNLPWLNSNPSVYEHSEKNKKIPPFTENTHVSIHLDGLQQTRAIVSEASFAFKQTLRRLNSSHSIAAKALQTFKDEPQEVLKFSSFASASGPLESSIDVRSKSPSPSRLGTRGSNISTLWKSAPQILDEFKWREEAEEEMKKAVEGHGKPHIEDIDGHPDFKWDQEQMLQKVFQMFDKQKTGCLSKNDMQKLIANHGNCFSLLKFTVFWSFLKKKQFQFFIKMFSSPSRHRYLDEESSNGSEISLTDWMRQAQLISREKKIPMRRIRLNNEHVEAVTDQQKGTHPWRNSSSSLNREAFVARNLTPGDVVWALHNKGVRWLPAVIERVQIIRDFFPHGPSRGQSRSSDEPCNYYVDVWYPLNQRDLMKVKVISESRPLLSFSSSQPPSSSSGLSNKSMAASSGILLPPIPNSSLLPAIQVKPLSSELTLCAQVFDSLDVYNEGIISLGRLIGMLRSPEFQSIVQTSVALTSIFSDITTIHDDTTDTEDDYLASGSTQSRSRNGTNRSGYPSFKTSSHVVQPTYQQIPSLLPVFIDTFSVRFQSNELLQGIQEDIAMESEKSPSHDLLNEEVSMIQKESFLEFCKVALDIREYRVWM